jgi:hypothetical protein
LKICCLRNYLAGTVAAGGTTVPDGNTVPDGATVAGGTACSSTLGAGASSFFLQPEIAKDKEATNSIATNIANIFFITSKLLSMI